MTPSSFGFGLNGFGRSMPFEKIEEEGDKNGGVVVMPLTKDALK